VLETDEKGRVKLSMKAWPSVPLAAAIALRRQSVVTVVAIAVSHAPRRRSASPPISSNSSNSDAPAGRRPANG
jgi:hypothetical protein